MIPYISELLSNAVHLQLPLMIYHIYNICDDIKPHLFINASHLISLTYANSLSCSTGPHRTQLPGNSGGFKISHDFFIFGKLRWIHDLTFYFPFSLSLFLSSLATQVASKSHIILSSLATQVAPRSHNYNGTNITLHVLQVVRPKNITFSFLLGCVQAFYLCINT